MRFSVEAWAPEYGISVDADDLEEVRGEVDATVESALEAWTPVVPASPTIPEQVMFVDGVRRIDARVWIHDGDRSHAGVCASVAAGVVTCSAERAEVTEVRFDRALFASLRSGGESIVTRHATYEFVPTSGDDSSAIYQAIHHRMTALEQRLAADHGCGLVVFDGPLRGRNDPYGVGYVKTQHVQYLPDEVVPVLGLLGDGDRTPMIHIGGGRGFARWSWYLRLPGPRTHPLSGIVRCEQPGVGSVADAIARAEEVSTLLPRFASTPHKEPRAPQNLYPIAGLEHVLRHRLGDSVLLERDLRVAAETERAPART